MAINNKDYKALVLEWKKANPSGTKAACSRDLSISPSTVSRYWNHDEDSLEEVKPVFANRASRKEKTESSDFSKGSLFQNSSGGTLKIASRKQREIQPTGPMPVAKGASKKAEVKNPFDEVSPSDEQIDLKEVIEENKPDVLLSDSASSTDKNAETVSEEIPESVNDEQEVNSNPDLISDEELDSALDKGNDKTEESVQEEEESEVETESETDDLVEDAEDLPEKASKFEFFKEMFRKKDKSEKKTEKKGKPVKKTYKKLDESVKKPEKVDLSTPYENPYIDNKNKYRDRIHRIAASNIVYKFFFMVMCLAILGQFALYIELSNRSHLVPYVLTVDQHGLAIGTGEAHPIAADDIENRFVVAEISSFIKATRTVTPDVGYLNVNQDILSAIVKPDDPAYKKLVEWFSGEMKGADGKSPQERARTVIVHVQIESIRQFSEEAFNCEWLEVTRSRTGELVKTATYRASISWYADQPSSDLKQIQYNPRGIYIKDFSWEEI